MELVKKLTKRQFEVIKEANGTRDFAMAMLCAVNPPFGEYHVGDSAVLIDSPKLRGVYSNEWKGKTSYNVVVNVLNKELAFCWILTPIV